MPLQLLGPRALCRQTALSLRLQCAARVLASPLSCDGGSSSDGAYDSLWEVAMPDEGNYTITYFQYQEDFGCVCMLNAWFSFYDGICADNHNASVQVEGQVSQC